MDDIGSMKKELKDIKAELLKKELDEIKHEKMVQDLKEIRAERQAAISSQARTVAAGSLSWPVILFASLSLFMAGFLAGDILKPEMIASMDRIAVSLTLPVSGTTLQIIVCAILVIMGIAFITIAKK